MCTLASRLLILMLCFILFSAKTLSFFKLVTSQIATNYMNNKWLSAVKHCLVIYFALIYLFAYLYTYYYCLTLVFN